MVGLAVIAGIVGLQALDDANPSAGSTSPTTSTSVVASGGASTSTGSGQSTATTKKASGKSTSTTKAASTSSTVAARAPSEVGVYVYNGSGVTGAAQTMSQKLKGLGYNTLGIANADTRTGTVVQCRTGYDKEATILATDIGNGAKAEAFPSNSPTGSENASCLVVLGK